MVPGGEPPRGRVAFSFQSVTGFYLIDAFLSKDPKIIVDVIKHLVLPSVTLGFAQAGLLGRMTRASMLEVLDADYITTARAKGVRERVVILSHALRNALIPIVTVFGLQFAILMGSGPHRDRILLARDSELPRPVDRGA